MHDDDPTVSVPDSVRRLNRRRLLALGGGVVGGAAALAGAGAVGYRFGADGAAPGGGSSPATQQSAADIATVNFRTRPDLNPPRVTITHPHSGGHRAAPRPGPGSAPYFFLAPKQFTTAGSSSDQAGPMIIDRAGHVVWFSPTDADDGPVMDFRAQRYRGQPVLTWWQGDVDDGHGQGVGVITDDHYRRITTVRAAGGLDADLHEFVITDRDTALITAYRNTTSDLSAIGGLPDGKVFAGIVQEIDIASGEVLFSWHSLDHVEPEETYQEVTTNPDDTLDYFHLNSIFELDDETLLISARNTWTVYCVDKPSGKITWRLGGKRSDFRHGRGTHFFFQHHATMPSANRMLIFDNGSSPQQESQSRGLVLEVDLTARTVELTKALTHPAKLLADSQGSVQQLPGNASGGSAVDATWLVGWGAEPYFSEFDADGTLVLDGKLPDNVQSYRTVAGGWKGHPTGTPDITVGTNAARGSTVYASWNGATEVDSWRVLAGSRSAALTQQAEAPHAGFESEIVVNSTGPYFQAVAMDSGGRELGRSDVLRAVF